MTSEMFQYLSWLKRPCTLLLEDRPGPELKMNYLKLINVYC